MRKIMLNGQWELAEAEMTDYVRYRFRDLCFPALWCREDRRSFYRTNEDVTRELFRKDYEFSRIFVAAEDILKEEK